MPYPDARPEGGRVDSFFKSVLLIYILPITALHQELILHSCMGDFSWLPDREGARQLLHSWSHLSNFWITFFCAFSATAICHIPMFHHFSLFQSIFPVLMWFFGVIMTLYIRPMVCIYGFPFSRTISQLSMVVMLWAIHYFLPFMDYEMSNSYWSYNMTMGLV